MMTRQRAPICSIGEECSLCVILEYDEAGNIWDRRGRPLCRRCLRPIPCGSEVMEAVRGHPVDIPSDIAEAVAAIRKEITRLQARLDSVPRGATL